MPGLNGMGPEGNGPMTGGSRGRCSGMAQEGAEVQFQFGGFGRKWRGRSTAPCRFYGGGFRRGAGFWQRSGQMGELQSLESEAAALETSLQKIKERIDQINRKETGS